MTAIQQFFQTDIGQLVIIFLMIHGGSNALTMFTGSATGNPATQGIMNILNVLAGNINKNRNADQ